MKRTLFPTHAIFHKALILFNFFFLIMTTGYSQGPKWTTLGNITATGDFIGPTNFEPLVFKTNNTTRGAFTASGDFQLSNLIGTGNRLLQTDANGNIIPFTMGNSGDVLYGDGTWGGLPLFPAETWQYNGSNIYYNEKVGIGTNSPLYPLDVIGDVRISNNLYVGGGIVISDKVNANSEVVTGKMVADSIVTDSTKGFYGTTKFNGDIRLSSKLSVDGNATVGGDFKTFGNVTFAGDKIISFTPATASSPAIFDWGGSTPFGGGGPSTPCYPLGVAAINTFSHLIQSYGDNSLKVMTMGWDGANGLIDVSGGATGNSRLLINYNCGKDLFACTGPLGGNIVLTSANTGTVAIGDVPVPVGYKLAVKGKVIAEEVNVRLFGDWPDYVFDEKYEFLTIPELKDFTEKEKHLPNMPTAENVEKDGVNLSEMVAKLLKSQEEQTKYIIQLYEQNLLLKKEIELLKK